MKISNRHILISFLLISLLSACHRDLDKPQDPQLTLNEDEVITTCSLRFHDAGGNWPDTTATYRDPDGDGGQMADIYDTIFLHNNTSYSATITLLNETLQPADTISNEVLEEAVDHLFCFQVAGSNIEIVRTDSDGNYEIGLQSLWTTHDPETGTVTVTLKHQPGIKDGTCEPGETDVEITFPLVIIN